MLRLAHQAHGHAEIFLAPQGEGPEAGRLSTFIRLSGCNLWCRWCDTPYTWRWDRTHPHDDDTVFSRDKEIVRLDNAGIAERVLALACPALVITGGEPLLQQKALVPLLRALRSDGLADTIDFETNGTILPSPSLIGLTSRFVVSPKLANSGVPERYRHTAALAAFAELEQAVFKFVVCDRDELTEIHALLAPHGVAAERIWLMPEGRDSATLRARMPMLRSLCERYGHRLSDRLHVHTHGDRRGV